MGARALSGFLITACNDDSIDHLVNSMRAWSWEVAYDLSLVRDLRGGLIRLGSASDWAHMILHRA